jgi:predicted phosphodiesterase
LKFVFASDIHFGNRAPNEGDGPFTPAEHFLFAGQIHAEKPDVLVVAGDCAETIISEDLLERFFDVYKNPHGVSICIPGNHDCWLANGSRMDARQKYDWFFRVARKKGWVALRDEPWSKDGVWVVGNMGWYDFTAADPQAMMGPEDYERKRGWSDYTAMRLDWANCKDPTPMLDFCRERMSELEASISKVPKDRGKLVVVTHIVGFDRLQRWFRRPDEYRAYMGNANIGLLVAEAGADIYYCGHTHRQEEFAIGGMRCINNGSGYGRGSKRFDVIEL